jgi:hypothetical protein
MAEPLPKTLEDAFAKTRLAVNALKRAKPATEAERRRRSAEIISMQRQAAEAAHRVADADAAVDAAKRLNVPADVVDKALLEELLPELARSVAQHVRETVEPLKKQITQLEARPVLEDGGVWAERALYHRGHVVSYKGSAWVCHEANSNTRPGKSNAWRLMVKSEQK